MDWSFIIMKCPVVSPKHYYYCFVRLVFIYSHSISSHSFPESLFFHLWSLSFCPLVVSLMPVPRWKTLSFHLSENVFITPSLLKSILAAHRILGWQKFIFSTLKICFHCPLAFIDSFEENKAFILQLLSGFSCWFSRFK